MAVATFRAIIFQRDDPLDSESGWTTDDATALNGDDMTTRGRVTVEDDSNQIGTAWLHFEVFGPDSSDWVEYGSAKFHDPHKFNEFPVPDSFYDLAPYHFFRVGLHRFRIRAEYDGDEHLSSEIEVTTTEATVEGVSRDVDASASRRAAGASAGLRASTAGAGGTVSATAVEGLVAASRVDPRAADAETEVASAGTGVRARSVTTEVEPRTADGGTEPRSAEGPVVPRSTDASAEKRE